MSRPWRSLSIGAGGLIFHFTQGKCPSFGISAAVGGELRGSNAPSSREATRQPDRFLHFELVTVPRPMS